MGTDRLREPFTRRTAIQASFAGSMLLLTGCQLPWEQTPAYQRLSPDVHPPATEDSTPAFFSERTKVAESNGISIFLHGWADQLWEAGLMAEVVKKIPSAAALCDRIVLSRMSAATLPQEKSSEEWRVFTAGFNTNDCIVVDFAEKSPKGRDQEYRQEDLTQDIIEAYGRMLLEQVSPIGGYLAGQHEQWKERYKNHPLLTTFAKLEGWSFIENESTSNGEMREVWDWVPNFPQVQERDGKSATLIELFELGFALYLMYQGSLSPTEQLYFQRIMVGLRMNPDEFLKNVRTNPNYLLDGISLDQPSKK